MNTTAERTRRAVASRVRGIIPERTQKVSPAPKVSIFVVNGFDRRGRWGDFNEQEAVDFPWIDLCLRQITRWTSDASYEVLIWDNTGLASHQDAIGRYPNVRLLRATDEGDGQELRHGQSLERLRAEVDPRTEFVVTMDTDSFPIRAGWLDNLTGRITDEVLVAGVWRDEMAPQRQAFVHPSCLLTRQSTLNDLRTGFTIGKGTDVGSRVTDDVTRVGKRISRLHRSNRWSPHGLMGGLYGDLVYHQGAGSRSPMFTGGVGGDASQAETIRQALRDTAFTDVDGLVDALAGNLDPSRVPTLAPLLSDSSSSTVAPPG